MNEINIIKTIQNIVRQGYIGDDCAYLKDLGIVISQDSLIENIHFKQEWCTPFQLGYKAVTVNISDILASGARPEYITVALSLPNSINENFLSEFYKGAKNALNGAEIVGGDITGSKNDIAISIAAIGNAKERNISSRSYAKPDYVLITRGNYGSADAGLKELINNGCNNELIKAHLEPELDYKFSETLSTGIREQYAMMDTSDGLCDALFKIAEASNVKIIADFNKIPHLNGVTEKQILFGGEDYHLVAAVPEYAVSLFQNISVIGRIVPFDGVRVDISGRTFTEYSELNTFNHFE
jgi:thiamine-monophosphate kinase